MTRFKVRARYDRVLHRAAGLLLPACLVGVPVVPAHAADVDIRSSVRQHFTVNDNPGLAAVSAGTLLTSRTSAAASILAQMPTFVIGTNVALTYNAYSGSGSGTRQNGFEFSDLNFHAAKSLKNTTFTASGSFKIDDTSTTQIDDTGIIDVSASQFTLNLNTGVSRNINRNNVVSVNVTATSVSFSEGATAFTPYTNVTVSGAWNHLVNSRIRTGVTSSVGFFQRSIGSGVQGLSFGTGGGSRTLVFRAGGNASAQLTDALSVSGGVGVNVTSSEGPMTAGATTAVGFSGNVSAGYQGKQTGLGASLSQSLDPSAAGELQNRTRVSLNASHNIPINGRSNVSLAAAYAYRRSSSSMGVETTSQRITFSPAYSIELTRHWDAALGYTYTYRIRSGEAAHSNTVYLTIARSGTLLP